MRNLELEKLSKDLMRKIDGGCHLHFSDDKTATTYLCQNVLKKH